jgi:DNA-binding MarR family transcriptional regulator
MHTGNVVVAWVTAVHDRLGDAIRATGLESRELSALTLVAEHDGCSGDWLRGRVGLTQSGTVRLVDRLVGRGLLRRGSAAGRGVPLHVTPQGGDVLADWARRRDALVGELLAGVPAAHRDEVVAGMAAALLGHARPRAQADATCRRCTWADCGDDCPVDRSVTGGAAPR